MVWSICAGGRKVLTEHSHRMVKQDPTLPLLQLQVSAERLTGTLHTTALLPQSNSALRTQVANTKVHKAS